MRHTLSVDLGGTWLRAALVRPDGTILRRESCPTPQGDPTPAALIALARGLLDGQGPVDQAVIGVPGRVDYEQGRLDHAPNLPPSWAPHLSAAALGAALGCRVSLANDADLAAVGEAAFGAGRGARDLVYVTFSTGVGAGVLLGGRLVAGRRSIAEAGHAVIDRTAWAAGEPATFEQLAAGPALARRAAALGLPLPAPEVVAQAAAGEPRARQALAAQVEAAAIGVRMLAYLFTPERVVVGGGLGSIGEPLLGPLREHLEREGPPGVRIAVVPAQLGDNAGVAGAAAWDRHGVRAQSGG